MQKTWGSLRLQGSHRVLGAGRYTGALGGTQVRWVLSRTLL